ncbi:protein phosphatase 2C domain-containing protein [Streptomyces sp. NPDC059668]|uniref:protein phosphatase 2C domain-containing protein n=1 Tax=Streptomyces sp. NPDC059668 TaxID=3346900 RepID=UPI0036CC9CD1
MTSTTWLIILLVLSLAGNAVLAFRLVRTGRAVLPSASVPTALAQSSGVDPERDSSQLQLEEARREVTAAHELLRGRDLELSRVRELLKEAQERSATAAMQPAGLRQELHAARQRLRTLEGEVRILARERDDARSDADGLKRRLAEAEAEGGTPLGPNALSPAIPRRLPLGRDATSDSSVDGADLGPLVVRAASVRGDRARREGEHRREAFLLRFVEEIRTPTLLSAVAAGVPHGRWSQSAADRACRNLAAQVARYGDALGHQLYRPAGSDDDLTGLLRTALQGVAHSMRLVTRGEGPGGEPDDAAIGVALTGLFSRLGDSRHREHVAFGIGDGALMVLRDGVWSSAFTPGGTAGERGLRLPAAAQQVRCARLTTRPGDLLALCSSSLAELLVRPEVGDWFAARWAGRQPYLTSFLSEVNVPVRSPGGDRTVVCLWDFGDARETPPADS